MSNANGHKNHTASGNAQAEELIARILSEMAETLKPTALSVYLGGSYGRGEGGVRQDSERGVLYNDLDFFVFAREETKGAEKLLREISGKYEHELGIDVDFSRIAGVKDIKRNRKRLMMQELKRGYRLVCGEDLLARYLPELPAEELPFSEACRLLLNRGMGLRFAAESAKDPDKKDFILRNINKAILGSGDARLIASGRYRWRIAERVKEIQNADLPDEWKKLYTDAAAFKSAPHGELPEDLPGFLEEVKEFFQASVLAVSGASSVSEIRQAMWERCRRAGELSWLNYVKYCVKTRKFHGCSKFLRMPTATIVLCKLFDKDVCGAELYDQWMKFN